MTDQEQEKPKQPNWLIKAGGDALLAGSFAGSGSLLASLIFDWSIETVPQVSLAGFTISLYTSWLNSKEKDKPKTKKGRSVPFNLGEKGRIDLEYSQQYMVREDYSSGLKRLIFGKKEEPMVRQTMSKPTKSRYQNEQVFRSYHDNYEVELLAVHIKLFLKSAWKHRDYGKGLSHRRWVRNTSQRPQWWKDLGNYWYQAFINLLREAQRLLRKQLVIKTRNNWYRLKFDDWDTYQWLYQAEWMKNNNSLSFQP